MTSTKLNPTLAAGMALGLGFILSLTPKPAAAADWGFSIGLGGVRRAPVVVAETTVQQWVPEHYEARSEQVLVSPAHYEKQCIPAQYETRRDRFGRTSSVCVKPETWTEVYVPDQYETRTVQVLVPGYYTTVSAPAVACAEPVVRPYVAIGFGHDEHRVIRYDDHREVRGNDHREVRGNDHREGWRH